jgi:DNA-binding HxlR family transcriptional regulator
LDTGRAAPGYEPRGAAARRPGAADPDAAYEMEASCEAEDAGETCGGADAPDEGDAPGEGDVPGERDVPGGARAEAVGRTCPGAVITAARPMMTCRAREVLQRVGDKWSVLVIDLLGQGTMRFTELHRAIDGITARMLTVTLRGLERDGIVTRTIHPVIPPRVEYALTPMGRTLLDTIGQLVSWTDSHLPEIEAARAAYDAGHPA